MRKKKAKIHNDYFSLSSKWKNLKYFIKQGFLFAHLIDRAKWRYCPKLFIVPSFPTHLEIEASSACQMRCPMCKTTAMTESGTIFAGFMDFDLYKKIIDEVTNESLYSIKLSWRGEPLLNPRIVEMVAYAKNKGIKDVAFLTNGERLNNKLSEDLVDAGLDWISISFDGFKEVYEKIRKPALFEETIEKIKHLRSYRDKQGNKKPLIRIQSIHSAIRGREEEFLNLWNGIADRVNFIADQKRSINKKDYRHDPSFVCSSPWQRLCISWDGKVTQCYSDYMEQNILGNVAEKTIKEIWRDEPICKLRELMKNSRRLEAIPCQTCSDGGFTDEEEVIVSDRKIKVAHYRDQSIDVKALESKIHK